MLVTDAGMNPVHPGGRLPPTEGGGIGKVPRGPTRTHAQAKATPWLSMGSMGSMGPWQGGWPLLLSFSSLTSYALRAIRCTQPGNPSHRARCSTARRAL